MIRSTPKAVLFDLFHTLVLVPPAASLGQVPVPELLGIPASQWQRSYYEEDAHGRGLGRVTDAFEAMRLVTHAIDPTIAEDRIHAAVQSRRRCFEAGLVGVDTGVLQALDRLRAAGIRTGLGSDAGADDVEYWPRSPLRGRFDVAVFSYQIGIRKPDPRVYLRALDAVAAKPADAIFVGDGGSDELRGARAVGLRTVLVTRLASHWPPQTVEARRAHADWEFSDVQAFVRALGF